MRGSIGEFFRGDPTIRAYWNLPSLTDLSGNGNHLTLNGNVKDSWGREHGDLSSKFGGSTSDYLSIDSNSSLKPAHFTLIVWVRFSPSEGNNNIISKYAAVPCEYEMAVGRNGYGFVRSDSSSRSYYAGDPDSEQINKVLIKDGNWHCMVGTYDGALHYYVDGQWKDSSASFTRNTSRTDPLNIGRRAYSGAEGPISGRVSEVAIFSRALTPSEISQYYHWAIGAKKKWSLFVPPKKPDNSLLFGINI